MPGKKKGKKVYGEPEEKRGKRENLVAGRRKKEKNLIALIIFGACWMNLKKLHSNDFKHLKSEIVPDFQLKYTIMIE